MKDRHTLEYGPAGGLDPISVAGRPERVRAAVSLPDGTTEIRWLDSRKAIDAVGWLRVDSSAVCGTDVSLYRDGLDAPTVLGHHVVGRVTEISGRQSAAWGVEVGDLVALEEYLPCQRSDCEACGVPGTYRVCPETDLWKGRRRIGLLPVDEGSGLHGGNAQYLQLSANSIVHRVPDTLSPELASWTQPFANAVDWTINVGGAREGSRVLVIGPGYHGVSVVAAARAAGAEQIFVLGTTASTMRLELAETMGAIPLVCDEGADLSRVIDRATRGAGVDLILDTVGLGDHSLAAATSALRKFGRLVLAGLGSAKESSLDLGALVRGAITVAGVRGRSPQAVAQALELLARGDTGVEHIPAVDVPLEGIPEMLDRLVRGAGPVSPHVVFRP